MYIFFFDIYIYTTPVNQVFQENTSTFVIFHGGLFPQNTNFNNSRMFRGWTNELFWGLRMKGGIALLALAQWLQFLDFRPRSKSILSIQVFATNGGCTRCGVVFFRIWTWRSGLDYYRGTVACVNFLPFVHLMNQPGMSCQGLLNQRCLTWVFPKIGVPQIEWFRMYHYFRKPPHGASRLTRVVEASQMFFTPTKSRSYFPAGGKFLPVGASAWLGKIWREDRVSIWAI